MVVARRGRLVAIAAAAAVLLASCSSSGPSGSGSSGSGSSDSGSVSSSRPGTPSSSGASSASRSAASSGTVVRPGPADGHVVVVLLENHSYSDVVGNPSAPYLNALARRGASLTDMHAVTHPSEPNYLALFSGSTQGVTDDACPLQLTGQTLGGELRRAGLSFVGYSEGLPGGGSSVCNAGSYARKHAPWTDFTSLPASTNQPLTSFPRDFARLPTVGFVIPDLEHDMHDGTIGQADTWIRQHLDRYATWATAHHSLLVVTWDEDDGSAANRIPTFVLGANVPATQVRKHVTLYSVLRTIEERYRLPRLGASASAPTLGLP